MTERLKTQKDNLAKLLAKENLTIVHRKVPTAYFDLKNRLLCCPILKEDISSELYDLFMGHEVSHALNTPYEGVHSAVTKNRTLKGYLNVVEDVRIERMIKDTYPGLRKSFFKAYNELMDIDFFGIKEKNLQELSLIDKINLITKCGSRVNINLTKVEKEFLDWAIRCQTWEEVEERTRKGAFKANKVINGQSTKQSGEKELYLYVAHRFGSIDGGIKTLFGLDIANTKIELLYGLSNNLQIGFSRESLKKIYTLNILSIMISYEGEEMPIYSLGEKKPQLPEQDLYWVAPDAHVIGNVILGREVGIWFGSVLRGDNDIIKIGNETNIQENTIIHVDPSCPVTIGDNCTIGHNAIIHGCTIGNNSLVGMGATILNNAKIGNNSLVGAGALVTENKEFPDGSLIVGSPAKAVRELSQDMIDNMTRSSKHYVTNFKKFVNEMTEIK